VCIPLWFLELVNGGLTFACAYASYQSKNAVVFEARWGPLVLTSLTLAVVVGVSILYFGYDLTASLNRSTSPTPVAYAGTYTSTTMASKGSWIRGRFRRRIAHASLRWQDENSLQNYHEIHSWSVIVVQREQSCPNKRIETGVMTWYRYTDSFSTAG
jgi:hypothetical protein